MRVTSAPTAQDRAGPQPEPDAAGVAGTEVDGAEANRVETGAAVPGDPDARHACVGRTDRRDGRAAHKQPAGRLAARLADLAHRPAARDLTVCLALVAAAGWLTGGLWPDPARRALALNVPDQALDEWFLAHATRVYAGELNLLTHMLNAPAGVNLLSNASLILVGVLLAPVTLVFGAPVTFAVVAAGNLAATGIGWYLVLSRTCRLHRFGAAVGGGFAAFAPGMVSQDNAHLHITAQWLVPPMVWCLVRLARTDDEVRDGTERVRRVLSTGSLLGVLVAAQLFLGEEVLFLTAFTLGLFCLVFGLAAPRTASRMLWPLTAGLATAGLLAVVTLAYPLWMQFRGPQHVPNGPFSPRYFSADLTSFTAISPLSFAGDPGSARLASGPAEYNTFLGLPLLLVVAGAVLWLWRRPVAVACGVTASVMCAMALGPVIVIDGVRTGRHGPYHPLEGLPVVDGALPSRFALAAIPLIAVLLALALHAAFDRGPHSDPVAIAGRLRLLVPIAVVTALIPIAPTPLPTVDRDPIPRFFSEGYWRTCVDPGGVLVPVPPPDPGQPDSMRWAAAANVQFGLPEGFFIGPYADHGQASVGTWSRPTGELMHRVARTGEVPKLSDHEKVAALRDIEYWGASCVVVAGQPHEAELRSMMDYLLGPGEDVADVRIWRIPATG
jgi:hypothetical protein